MKRFLLLALTGLTLACQAPAPANASGQGMHEHTIKSGGLSRSYRVYRPASAGGDTKRPLVVALHGGLGTGEIMAEQSRFDAIADREGFLVAYPDGVSRAWNAGRCCGKPQEKGVDDVAFIREMVAQIARDYPVDSGRVYGTGFSNGAMLTHRIACEAPGLFRAIAPVSGGIMLDKCDTRKAVPVLLIQGKLDKRIPWDGGTVEDTYRPSISAIVDNLAKRNGCGDKVEVVQQRGQLTCWRRSGCDRDPVEWCGLEKVGHQWPGGKTIWPKMLGANTQAFSASEGIWAFFKQH